MYKKLISLIIVVSLLPFSPSLLPFSNNVLTQFEQKLPSNINETVDQINTIPNIVSYKINNFFSSFFSSDGFEKFRIQNLSYNDACYYGISLQYPLEWWYFDAVFDNNYSMEFHMNLGIADKAGVIVPMLNIYNDTRLVYHAEEYHPISNFYGDKEKPVLFLEDKKIIEGHVNEQGNWFFTIDIQLDNCGVNVSFNSTTQGWKSNIIDMWWYGVIQPHATVKGSIWINDTSITVNGSGYQEHAWKGKPPTVKGWYWGRFESKNFSVIWTKMIKSPWRKYDLMVINEKQGTYTNLHPEYIDITPMDYHGVLLQKKPHSFTFSYQGNQTVLSAKSDTKYITHQRSIGIFNYWRYHVHVNGTILHNSITNTFNNTQIMDFTQFY